MEPGGIPIQSLSSVLDRVNGSMETLTIYNYDGPEKVIDDLWDHFGRRLVMVEESTTETAEPTNFAVLHDGDRFVSASGVEAIHEVIDSSGPAALSDPGFDWSKYPDVLEHTATTAFSSYDKRRMVLASREAERRAWKAGTGELHAGFQRLSLLDDQWERYCALADRDVDVHVYGVPDCELPSNAPLTVHHSTDREIRDHWFVAFNGGTNIGKALLLSEERRPGAYYGCWTRSSSIVDGVIEYLRDDR